VNLLELPTIHPGKFRSDGCVYTLDRSITDVPSWSWLDLSSLPIPVFAEHTGTLWLVSGWLNFAAHLRRSVERG
jgi:hypothetical protein